MWDTVVLCGWPRDHLQPLSGLLVRWFHFLMKMKFSGWLFECAHDRHWLKVRLTNGLTCLLLMIDDVNINIQQTLTTLMWKSIILRCVFYRLQSIQPRMPSTWSCCRGRRLPSDTNCSGSCTVLPLCCSHQGNAWWGLCHYLHFVLTFKLRSFSNVVLNHLMYISARDFSCSWPVAILCWLCIAWHELVLMASSCYDCLIDFILFCKCFSSPHDCRL